MPLFAPVSVNTAKGKRYGTLVRIDANGDHLVRSGRRYLYCDSSILTSRRSF